MLANQDNFLNSALAREKRTLKHRYAARRRSIDPINAVIQEDKAIQRYYGILASRKKNAGIVSKSTKRSTIYFVKLLAAYIRQPITNHFITELIQAFKKGTQEYKDSFLDTIQDFSNQEPLKAHRTAASIINGIFKANRHRLEVFVDNHFSIRTQRITEGILAEIIKTVDYETRLADNLLAFGGERKTALCKRPITQWHEENNHWVIDIKATQSKARVSHICVIPKSLGDAIITLANKENRKCPFPNEQSLFSKQTALIQAKFGIRLTAHHWRKRFATIASLTPMPPNDWDLLQGSKMGIGHEADTYQLEDNPRIILEYGTYLENNLAIGNTTVTNRDSEPDRIRQLNSVIQSQQQTILALTQQLTQLSAHSPRTNTQLATS